MSTSPTTWRLKDLARLWARGKITSRLGRGRAQSLAWALWRVTRPEESWWVGQAPEAEHLAFTPKASDPTWAERGRALARAWDRLISIHGADAEVSLPWGGDAKITPAARKKADRQNHQTGQTEISDGPHTNPDANTHGGDGNSGEMDHRAETAAPNRQGEGDGEQPTRNPNSSNGGINGLGQGSGQPGGESTRPKESQAPDASAPEAACMDPHGACRGTARETVTREGAERPAASGGHGGGNPTGEMGTHAEGQSRDGDERRPGQPAPPEAVTSDADRDHTGRDHEARGGARAESATAGEGGTPSASTSTEGGAHLSAGARRAAERRIPRGQMKDAARLIAALRRLVEQTCAPRGETTPRYDARALTRELVSRRMALHRAHRHESEIRDLVIAVDQSGSCSATVGACYAAAMQVARMLPPKRVSILLHSNGFLCEAGGICAPWLREALAKHSRALARAYYARSQQAASERVWQAIADRRPGLVLVLGDSDSDWAHELLAERGVRVVLMTHEGKMGRDATYDVIPHVIDIATAADGLWRHITR